MAAAYSWGIKLVQIGTRIARNHGVYAKDQCHVIHVRANPISVGTSHATASSLLPSCCHPCVVVVFVVDDDDAAVLDCAASQVDRSIDRIATAWSNQVTAPQTIYTISKPFGNQILFYTLVVCAICLRTFCCPLSLSLSESCLCDPPLGTIIAAEAVWSVVLVVRVLLTLSCVSEWSRSSFLLRKHWSWN
jgi:hypothetical protein